MGEGEDLGSDLDEEEEEVLPPGSLPNPYTPAEMDQLSAANGETSFIDSVISPLVTPLLAGV